jgi:hypothetical protein
MKLSEKDLVELLETAKSAIWKPEECITDKDFATDEIDKALALLRDQAESSEGGKCPEWRPISEMPSEGENIILVSQNGPARTHVAEGYWRKDGFGEALWRWSDHEEVLGIVTHWMPLPDPPATGQAPGEAPSREAQRPIMMTPDRYSEIQILFTAGNTVAEARTLEKAGRECLKEIDSLSARLADLEAKAEAWKELGKLGMKKLYFGDPGRNADAYAKLKSLGELP